MKEIVIIAESGSAWEPYESKTKKHPVVPETSFYGCFLLILVTVYLKLFSSRKK